MKNNSLSAWNVREEKFPKNRILESKIKFLIRYGILAPSGHNSQPWKFKIENNRLTVLPDYERRRPTVDPDNRELFISLGAASKNIEIAANYFGMIYKKTIKGDEIRFQFEEGCQLSRNEKEFKAITERQTNRGSFGTNKEVVTKNRQGIKIIRQKSEKMALADLIYGSDVVWFQTKELNEELDRWLTKDVTGQAEIELPGLKMSVKTLEEAEIRAENDRKLAKEAVALAIIYSNKDNTEEWIKAGENYEQLALEITVEGLAHSFFNTVVELETRRKKLTKGWVENACPQLVIRIGVAKEKPKHTPRRDIKEVLI